METIPCHRGILFNLFRGRGNMYENPDFKKCMMERKTDKTISRLLRSMMILFFILLSARATSPDIKVAYIPVSEPVDAYGKLIKAIVQVESSGDSLAYNVHEDAVGAFQIRKVRLKDYNRRTGKNYSHKDCYSYKVSKEIFLYYAIKIGYQDYESIARRWNGSGKLTHDYWKRVKAYL